MLKSICTASFLFAIFFCTGQVIKVDTSKSLSENDKILQALADTAFARGYNINYQDSLDFEEVFILNFLKTIKMPKSFAYKFPFLTKPLFKDFRPDINIVYSNDSLFRIFNWLSPTTGTLHHFRAIFQAKNKDNKTITSYPEATYQEGNMASTCYTNIYRLKSSIKQLYLCIGYGQGSGRLPFEMVETFEVMKDSIKGADILPDSIMTSSIFVDREATAYDNKPQDIPEIKYDTKKEILIVPEIKGNYNKEEDVRWTGKYIRYEFKGNEFVKVK